MYEPHVGALEFAVTGPFQFMGIEDKTGLAVLQADTTDLLSATGHRRTWKVKPNLLRRYYFPSDAAQLKP